MTLYVLPAWKMNFANFALTCLLTMGNFAADIKPVAKFLLWPSSSVQAAFLSAG
jgi:hypothetical protein